MDVERAGRTRAGHVDIRSVGELDLDASKPDVHKGSPAGRQGEAETHANTGAACRPSSQTTGSAEPAIAEPTFDDKTELNWPVGTPELEAGFTGHNRGVCAPGGRPEVMYQDFLPCVQ